MKYFTNAAKVIESLNNQNDKIKFIANIIIKRLKDGKKILIAGNGGSAADAQHFAGELTCTFKDSNRRAYPAISLMDNNAAITAWSNDFFYNSYVERQLKAFACSDDILFLLSTSGGNQKLNQSLNLINAAIYAKKNNILVISLLGKGGGELFDISDHSINVESQITSHIQEAHITVIHYICNLLEE